jgi:hypothetical protein
MNTFARPLPSMKTTLALAGLTFIAGVGGMAVSFVFLSSASNLDVVAGAAGFVAGSVLAASGLLSIAVLRRSSVGSEENARPAASVLTIAPERFSRWLTHFQRNREKRPEPDWNAPITLPSDAVQPLVHSLEQFQLGDGGGPACLIAWDAERFRSSNEGTRTLVDLWFLEEREHSRLLADAVARFGGRCIQSHWSFTAFCFVRKCIGVRFELTVLLLTEIVSTVYYKLLRRHGEDPALRSMCQLILRDEAGHVAFHRDRLAQAARAGMRRGKAWEFCFRTLGMAAATMLWVNHAPALRALGATRTEFYREIGLELSRFVLRLRRESRPATARPANLQPAVAAVLDG